MKRFEQKLEEEISNLLSLANAKDESEIGLELDVPKEIERREGRLEKIRKAKKVVEQRAKERYDKQKDEYDSKINKRNQKQKDTGKKTSGRKPKPPSD